MKYVRLISAFVLLIAGHSLQACDFCNYYQGINPNYNQDALGFRYRTSSYKGSHSHQNVIGETEGHVHGAGTENKEFYGTYALWGRWYPKPKLQLMGSFPVSDNYVVENGKRITHITGVGDLTMVGRYQVLSSFVDSSKSIRQKVLLGGGLKLPTGVYQKTNASGEFEPLIQPGSGSVDFIVSLNYLAKLKKAGLDMDMTYRINTANKNEFKFANRFNVTALLFYQIPVGAFAVMPSAGVYYEQAETDLDKDTYLQNTGGTVLFNQVGLDVYYKKYALNFGYQIPVYERLYGEQGINQNRLIFGLNYAFN